METSSEACEIVSPEDQLVKTVADYHSTKYWRESSTIQERRYVLNTPADDIANNLTANALAGGNKISAPPFVFLNTTENSVHVFYHLGPGLAGHRGMLHGGLFGVLLDECMGLASFTALPNRIGVTASLDITYQAPIRIPGIASIKAVVERSEGRKAWVVATVESPDGTTIFAKAKALFIEPRDAGSMNQLI